MSAPDGRNWWLLGGVAVVMALLMAPVVAVALLSVLFASQGLLLDPTGNPPFWLMVLLMVLQVTVAWVLLLIPGAVVGRLAGLSRGWRRTAAVMAALGGVGTMNAWGGIVGAVPGLIGGSLLAVVLADLGEGGVEVPPHADRPGPMRAREDRVIAGVCGGWARAHGWKPVRVRVLTVVAAVVAEVAVWPLVLVMLVLYGVAWLTWPLEPAADSTPRSAMV